MSAGEGSTRAPAAGAPSRAAAGQPAVGGFRVKSGRAAAVLVGGRAAAPHVLHRCEVALCDEARPETRQPYHAGFGSLETNPRRLEPRLAAARRAADAAVGALLATWAGLGVDVRAAALVVGSLKPPEAIPNEHVRAHALEGQFFRTVLADALAARGVSSEMVLERKVYGEASAALGRDEPALRVTLAELGRPVGRPWQADHKLATAAAWMRLRRDAG